jgi:hypothetical protein
MATSPMLPGSTSRPIGLRGSEPGTCRRPDDKRDIYGRFGIGDLWLVDPKARTLKAFEHARVPRF